MGTTISADSCGPTAVQNANALLSKRGGAHWWILAALLTLGCMLRLGIGLLAPRQLTLFDDSDYLGRALYFARGGQNDPWRPAMQYWMLGFALRLTNASFIGTRLAQALVSCLALLLVYPVARTLVRPTAALIAVAITCFSPEFYVYATVMMTEPLTMLFVLGAVGLSCMALRQRNDSARQRFPLPLLAGLCWGMAALTRGEFLYIGIAVALAVWWRTRATAAKWPGVCILLGLLLTVGPYTCRNVRAFHTFLPVSDDSSYALWEHWSRLPQTEINKDFFVNWSVAERNRRAMAKALGCLRADPLYVGERCIRSFLRVWTPDNMLISAFYQGMFGTPHNRFIKAQYVAVAGLIALMLIGYLLCSVSSRRRTALVVLHVVVVGSVLLHAIAFGSGRHRTPFTPLMLAVAAEGFFLLPELARANKRRLGLACGGGAAVIGATWLVLAGETRQMIQDAQASSPVLRTDNRAYKLMAKHFEHVAHISRLRYEYNQALYEGRPATPVQP